MISAYTLNIIGTDNGLMVPDDPSPPMCFWTLQAFAGPLKYIESNFSNLLRLCESFRKFFKLARVFRAEFPKMRASLTFGEISLNLLGFF